MSVALRRLSASVKDFFDLIPAHARHRREGKRAPVVSVQKRLQSLARNVPLMLMVSPVAEFVKEALV